MPSAPHLYVASISVTLSLANWVGRDSMQHNYVCNNGCKSAGNCGASPSGLGLANVGPMHWNGALHVAVLCGSAGIGRPFTNDSPRNRLVGAGLWKRGVLLLHRIYACESAVGLDSGLCRLARRNACRRGSVERGQRVDIGIDATHVSSVKGRPESGSPSASFRTRGVFSAGRRATKTFRTRRAIDRYIQARYEARSVTLRGINEPALRPARGRINQIRGG